MSYQMRPLAWTEKAYSSFARPPSSFSKLKDRPYFSTAADCVDCAADSFQPNTPQFTMLVQNKLLINAQQEAR